MRWTELPGNHVGHGEKKDRRREYQADPEPPRHVDQLRVGFFLQAHGPGFEGHAAYGTETRLRANDLRMHGTNVLCLYGWSGRSRGFQSHTALGASAWLGLADLGIHRTDVGSLPGFI